MKEENQVKEQYRYALHSAVNLCLPQFTEMQYSKLNLSFTGAGEDDLTKNLFLKQLIIPSDAKTHEPISLNCKFEWFYIKFFSIKIIRRVKIKDGKLNL